MSIHPSIGSKNQRNLALALVASFALLGCKESDVGKVSDRLSDDDAERDVTDDDLGDDDRNTEARDDDVSDDETPSDDDEARDDDVSDDETPSDDDDGSGDDDAVSGAGGATGESDDDEASPGAAGREAGQGTDTPDAAPSAPLIAGSREAIVALLESGAYREPPWVAQTEGPRERASVVSPHGEVRVFANDVLLSSIAKGNGVTELDDGTLETSLEGSHDTGSVAVKEFYTDGEVVGRAVLVKVEGGQSQAAYYCEGPPDRCGTEDLPPIYGVGFGVACGICHGGLVFTVNFPDE